MKVLEDGTVKGTFKHVSGYTKFSSDPTQQSGYYFPFHLAKTGEKMEFIKNGDTRSGEIPWEADNVFLVTSSDTFEVQVDGKSVITFKFNQANFNEE